MNKEQDYASDTDESDEDFQPDELAGESPASEDEEADDSEANREQSDGEPKEKPVKRKRPTKKLKTKKKSKGKNNDSEDEDCEKTHNTSRRATRRTDESNENCKGKCLEKDELVSDEEDKSRTNALWADFLNDVNPKPASSKPNASKVEDKTSSSSSTDKKITKESKTATNEIQPQTSLRPKSEENKVKITEVLDFAGEEVRIEREVDASSIKENKAATIPPAKKQPFSRIMPGAAIKRAIPTAATGSSAGLGSILNQLGKKKKLSVLEKSQMDWNSFKQTEGIDEQLQTFNKGKDGYLERQDFLQRTDLRQFEIEKNLRQSTRRPF
ncbi:yeti [Cochliomyia hominivorax]